MAVSEPKATGRRINTKVVLGLAVVVAVIVAAVATDSLVIGYIGATLVLCAFFVVVAFDVGAPPRGARSERQTGQGA